MGRIQEGLVMRVVAGEAVVIGVGAQAQLGAMIRLNRTGQAVWDGLARGLSDDEIAAQLVEAFDIDAAQARADVAAFVRQATAEGLLAQ